ncbi:hypothetical protein [Virgisporangium ochraceum]|uniref:hypothetical protein n=1 Tax=Virgisporangium ochraceum TaxID=65505 RepID=UPI001940A565|nr:hypothetical protein [Virgisporangium ochraceum]
MAVILGTIAVCVTLVCSVAGLVVWRLTRDGDSARSQRDPFPTAALQRASAPFKAQLGACELDRVGSAWTDTTCEPAAGAPGPIVFTQHRTPTDRVPASSAEIYQVWGPRNGGLLRVDDRGLNWRDDLKIVSIQLDMPDGWNADKVTQWWDETTAGAVLSTPENNALGTTSGSPAPVAAAPETVAGLPYLVRSFARPWWNDLKSCTEDVRHQYSFYPVPPVGIVIDEMYYCELRDGWQKAGGFDKIMFVAWDNRQHQRMDHKSIKDVFGAEKVKDQPGLAGPRSGMFMVADFPQHCMVYWDDESVAVAAWAFAPCRKDPKTTPATVTTFWQSRG